MHYKAYPLTNILPRPAELHILKLMIFNSRFPEAKSIFNNLKCVLIPCSDEYLSGFQQI